MLLDIYYKMHRVATKGLRTKVLKEIKYIYKISKMGRGRAQRPVSSPGIKPPHQWQQKQAPEAPVPPNKAAGPRPASH